MELNSSMFLIVTVIFAIISEVLPLIPTVKANGIFDMVFKAVSKFKGFITEKPEIKPPTEPKL